MSSLQRHYEQQSFGNGYALVDGVEQHRANPRHFLIPPAVIRRQVRAGMFVELRLVSDRFSAHEASAEQCQCPSCAGEMSIPVLRHDHPQTLQSQQAASSAGRGWGEDFWVQVEDRNGQLFSGSVDNHLVESRFHGVEYGARLFFREEHILAVHHSHRLELVQSMSLGELQELALWLGTLRTDDASEDRGDGPAPV